MTVYFLTGATGAVGSALVPALLENSSVELRLLIRARNDQELYERLDALFRFWELGEREGDGRRRVRALRGDATLPRFGLNEADFAELSHSVTHIIHAAGAVRMNLPIEDARRSAVESARQILALAHACQERGILAKVEMVSTVGVGGRMPVVVEDWITQPRAFHNTYEQAKAEAEELIREHLSRGLPITVHRPSMVVGDARTGKIIHYQVFYHLCEFLSGRRTHGLYPSFGDARLDTVPADHVARVLHWASSRDETAGQILHICSGPEGAIPLTELKHRVRTLFKQRGLPVPPAIALPRGLFSGILGVVSLFLDDQTRRAVKTLPVFLEYLSSEQRFEDTKTRQALRAAGINPPHWEAYLVTILRTYLAGRYPQRS